MIRVLTGDEPENITITIDGKLSGESIEPVEVCCIEVLSKGTPVRLYLRDVSAIDECGRTMLRRVAAAGINLSVKGIL